MSEEAGAIGSSAETELSSAHVAPPSSLAIDLDQQWVVVVFSGRWELDHLTGARHLITVHNQMLTLNGHTYPKVVPTASREERDLLW